MKLDNLTKDIKSWKTTLVGWLTGGVIITTQLIAVLDSDPETVFNMTIFLTGLAALGIGTFAKDGDKSTKDVS